MTREKLKNITRSISVGFTVLGLANLNWFMKGWGILFLISAICLLAAPVTYIYIAITDKKM